MAKDNDTDVIVTADETRPFNHTSDSLTKTRKQTGPEGAVENNDNDQNDISVTSDETDSTDQTSDSMHRTENEAGLDCAIVSDGDQVTSSNQTEKKMVAEGVINSYDDDQHNISLTSNEMNGTDPTSDSLFPTEKETNTYEKAGELTIVEVKYPEEEYLPGSSHEVDSNGDESQEEGATHEVDDSDDESSEISSIENEDEELHSSDDNSNAIPDGDTTEDLYALLAMSKKRLASNKTDIEDEESEGKVDETINPEIKHNEETQHNDHEGDTDEKNSAEKLNPEDDDSELSFSSATSRDNVSGTKPEQESAHPDQEGKKKKKDKHNAELWALLKYSQLRLSSGAIPTIAEGESEDLDIDIDEGLSYADDDVASSQGTADSKRVLTDIEEDEDDLSLADEDTVKEWSHGIDENARARALAALAKVSDREVKLSDKQLKQSVKLAEEAARTGAPEFRTRNNLSALDKVQVTDTFRKSRVGNVQQSRRSGEKRVPLREKFNRFKMNWRKSVDDFKKTCDRAATIGQ